MSLMKKMAFTSRVEDSQDSSLLDLPELVFECIIERLPPSALCQMAGVCRSLRERSISDYFWEMQMKQEWGRFIGKAAYREWQWHIASKQDTGSPKQGKHRGLTRFITVRMLLAFSEQLKGEKFPENSSDQEMLEIVMSRYEKELTHPIQTLLGGELARALLIIQDKKAEGRGKIARVQRRLLVVEVEDRIMKCQNYAEKGMRCAMHVWITTV